MIPSAQTFRRISLQAARRAASRWVLALFLLGAWGCGYALEGTRRPENLRDAKSIAIPIFQDETNEPGLGFLISQSVRQRFLNDGRLRVVESGGADVQLDAIVREYRLDPIGFSRTDQVQRYRILIKSSIRLSDHRTGKVLLRQEIESDSEYDIDSTVSGSALNRDTTNRQAADFFAEELLSLILEGF
jgi:hypothetical protein